MVDDVCNCRTCKFGRTVLGGKVLDIYPTLRACACLEHDDMIHVMDATKEMTQNQILAVLELPNVLFVDFYNEAKHASGHNTGIIVRVLI